MGLEFSRFVTDQGQDIQIEAHAPRIEHAVSPAEGPILSSLTTETEREREREREKRERERERKSEPDMVKT